MIRTAFNTYSKFDLGVEFFSEIFGPDVIQHVYVLKLFGPLDLILAAKERDKDPDRIFKLDRQDIILEMANGHLVQFTATPLGASIRPVNRNSVILEEETTNA